MLYGDCSYRQLTEHSGGTCKEEAKIIFSLEDSGANDSCFIVFVAIFKLNAQTLNVMT